MSKKQIALAVLLVILIVVLVAAIIVDSKFAAILSSPKISYESLVKPETRAEIVIDVPKLKDIIKRKLPANVPDWLLPRALPYEAALVANLDYVLNKMDLTLFINDQRLAPVLLDQINRLKLPAPLDRWFSEKMAWKERGKMIRKGEVPMDMSFLSRVKGIVKGKAGVGAPLRIEGGHLFEAALDNRDGSLLAMAGTIAAAATRADVTDPSIDGYLGMVAPLDAVRVQADLTDPKTLQVHIALECAPGTEAAQVQMLSMGLSMGLSYAQQPLAKAGITLTGKAVVKDNIVTGDYTVPNFDAVLAKM